MIYYACSYVPLELLKASGVAFKRIEGIETHEDDFIHRNICGYCKSVYEQINRLSSGDIFVSVDSCDGMRRIGDVLRETSEAKVFTLRLPWRRDDNAVSLMENELRRLLGFLDEELKKKITETEIGHGIAFFSHLREHILKLHKTGVDYSLISEVMKEAECGNIKNVEMNCTDNALPRIGVFGGITDSGEMNRVIETVGGKMVLNDSCRGFRAFTGTHGDSGEPLRMIARRLIESRIPCARFHSEEDSTYEELIEELKIDGAIYVQPKFCDFYGFTLAELDSKIPCISVELDYPTEDSGQLKTRVGAFVESMRSEQKTSAKKKDDYYVGIDSGSTTTNLVLIDCKGKIVAWKTARTGLSGWRTAKALMEEAVVEADLRAEDIGRIIATGYGRDIIEFAHDTVTEISCHARGAKSLFPRASTVIDIGGQDSKVIRMDEAGKVVDFVMNDKCAAGTGRFLEVMSGVLETDLDSMAVFSEKASKSLSISSMCTVFAESEVVSLIGKGEKIENISAGLFESIAKRVVAMYKRVKGTPPLVFTGGVARNRGVVKAVERLLDTDVVIPEIPDIVGAYGAALFASEKGKRNED